MHEVLNVLLIRFAITVGGLTLLIIAGFTVAIVLKRRGALGRARRMVEPAVRAWAARPDGRPDAPGGRRGGGRAELGRLAVRGALHYMDQAQIREERPQEKERSDGDRRGR
ncbi:hypothetical protein [Actinomadura violacea]|uniref:Uncharacterized protein n=1 Tax=Actinomadura violacea TaxID=2819934 RepID=A0ABS3RM29_9ACTN|nr:hypothetical protein [Actinomadura violacea]MBO2457388.1 hypothetical protein [Actinomadura violacea]